MNKEDIIVNLVVIDDDLLDIIPLKRADDIESSKENISEYMTLHKVIKLREDGRDFWIAREFNRAIGYAVGIVRGESYYSEGIYVIPEKRGEGLGALLKKAQIEFARALRCNEIYTNFAIENEVTRKIHEKLGFNFESLGNGLMARLKLS